MFPSQILRIGAVVLISGGILGVMAALISPTASAPREQIASPFWAPSKLLGMAAWLFTLVALPAAYARMARTTGTLGLLGFAGLVAAGVMVGFFPYAINLLLLPWLVNQPIPAAELEMGPEGFAVYFPIGLLLISLGAVLFGLAVVRSGVFSRWPGYLLIAGGITNLVAFADVPEVVWSIAGALFSAGLVWLGYDLWRNAGVTEAERIEKREDLAA